MKRKSWVARLRSVRTVSEKGVGDDDSEWLSEESAAWRRWRRDRRSAGADGSSSGAAEVSSSLRWRHRVLLRRRRRRAGRDCGDACARLPVTF